MKSFNLANRFVVLSPDKVATTVLNSPTVYEDLDRDFGSFKSELLRAVACKHSRVS